jgi:hypothetical protein
VIARDVVKLAKKTQKKKHVGDGNTVAEKVLFHIPNYAVYVELLRTTRGTYSTIYGRTPLYKQSNTEIHLRL